MRYFVQLAYDGRAFHGWQIQPNAATVQEVIEERMSVALQEQIAVVGCGRTDTSVSAKDFYLHFDSETGISEKDFLFKINRMLPQSIVFKRLIQVDDYAHARFDATSRAYEYKVLTQKDPFNFDFGYRFNKELNIDLMNEACSILFEYTDFTSFSKLHTDTMTNNCKIKYASWRREGDVLVFRIEADRFLRNMVRAIVGTMIELGTGKIEVSEFKTIIEAKDRGRAGKSVPGKALALVKIEYPYIQDLV